MKKVLFFSILSICSIMVLTGCGKEEKEQVLTCILHTNDVVNGYTLEGSYEIEAKGGVALQNTIEEVVTSDSIDILDYFEEEVDATYEKYQESYGGYTYSSKREEGKYISNVVIRYDEMNLALFAEDQPTLKSYLVNNNTGLELDGLKNLYESLGASCTLETK